MEEELVETPEVKEVETPVEEEPQEPETPEEPSEEPEEGEPHKAPTIPRKAYKSEKEKRQRYERENAELKKQLEQRTAPPALQKQPQTIEEYFDADPAGTLAYVEQQIREARDAYDPDKEAHWRNQKTDLVARGLLNQQRQATVSEHVARVNAEIYKAVPDFEAKRPEIEAMAVDFGLTEKEAKDIFNPAVVGDSAARMAKVFAKVHAIANAGRTAKAKEVKTATKVEPAGSGGFSNNNSTTKQLNRAKETGNLDDWAALLG